jgi:hypothetical protein
MVRFLWKSLFLSIFVSVSYANFTAYNDCIRSSGDTTVANVTDWTLYNGYTTHYTGALVDYTSGTQTTVTATFTWNSSAGLSTSDNSGSADGESQPRPGTPAYEVFGQIVDFSNHLIYYGSSGWWVEIEFTGLNPSKTYTFVTTAIRGSDYTDRLTLFTLSNHTSAVNNSSEGVYLKNGDQTTLIAGGNHRDTTGYVVRWDDIHVSDQGDGTGKFKVRAQATGTNYRAYPFGGFMLQEIGNAAPAINAGQDQTLYQPKEYLTLTGSVTDDGKGDPDGYLQSTWSQIAGSATAEFLTDIHQTQITARFPSTGDYQLRLTATDGELTSYDDVTVTVGQPLCPAGDMDSDCQVEMSDLNALALAWLEDISFADLNGDGIVNIDELKLLTQSWLEDWTGSLQVTILPVEAVTAGAQWRMDGGDWQASGTSLLEIPEGTHQIEYATVYQWLKPDAQDVTVARQQTTAISGQYSIPLQEVVINEFMAVNSNILDLRPLPSVNLSTQVGGQPAYDDWIEMRNLTTQAISLEGWYLTDNPDNLTKWRFPAGYTIPAEGYFVVYASNKEPEKYGYPFIDDLGSLHTNFELSLGGEYLALVRPDGQWIEHEYNDYPQQRGLVTYGIGSGGQVGYLTGVTRGGLNTDIYEGLVADTQFSVDRGFYDAPFTVILTCSTPDAVIQYTTDTSEPTATTGTVYSAPIAITTTTCLRAAAFKPNYLASNVDTQTYIFLEDVIHQATNQSTGAQVVPAGYPATWPGGSYCGAVTGDYQMDPDITTASGMFGSLYAANIKNDLKAIPSISIVIPFAQFFGTTTGIYINQAQDSTERFGSAEFIDPNGVEKWHINCGVQMQGGSQHDGGGTTLDRWKSYKLSLRLQFRGVYGGQLDYPLFGTDAADSYDTVVLDSRPQNSWVHATEMQRIRGEYCRDQASSDTQRALGGYACHGRPLHVYLNGLYWGMYWMHERPDDSFAASYLGGNKDDYDILKHDYGNVVSGDNADYIAMFNLSATSPDAVTAFNNLQAKLDVAGCIDYLLANFYLGNNDWDHKNWYASHNHFDPAGRWRWHMWDGEHVMDDSTYTTVDATTKNNYRAPTGLNQTWIANAEYRMLFADRVHKHFFHNGTFMPDNFAALFTNLTDQIDRAIVGESARWGDNRRPATPYTRNAEWITEVNRLLTSFIPTRRNVVLAQFTSKNPQWYPSTAAPEFYINGTIQYGGDAAAGANLTMSTGGNTVWYTLDGTDPRLPGGAVNSAATSYSTVIPLSKSVLVKARARTTGGVWSALAEAVFDAGPVLENLRVTELMYHPDDPNLEFIELKNIGTQAINLNLVQFTNGINHTFGDISVQTGGFLVLVKNQTLFNSCYTGLPVGTIVVQWTEGSLDNGGEKITIRDSLGRKIQTFSYKDSWYPLTDGDGFSLSILDPSDTDLTLWEQKIGWRASTVAGGSPGADEVGLAPDSIVINELLAHSDDTLPDWIELHNTTTQPISIGGWFLSDDAADLTKFEISANTEIAAGGYVVFYEDQHFGSDFALSENGETLYLTGGVGGAITGYQVSQQFDASEQNISLGRYIRSDGNMDFVAISSVTIGAANAAPVVGPIVISEIQYNSDAANTGDEYIELHNISLQTVVLQDLVKTETAPDVFEDQLICWSITEGIDFTFPTGTQILAGGYLIVARNPAAFSAYYTSLPSGTQVLGPFENDTALSNGGEKLRLCKPGEQLYGQMRSWIRADQVTYDDMSPWPTTPDGGGQTLQRITHSAYGNDSINWNAANPAPGI